MERAAFTWEEATTSALREAVYRFRYSEYFASRDNLPGTDHTHCRVWLPHDDVSQHFLARNASGAIIAVGSATPANEPMLREEWKAIFAFDRLTPLLPYITLISRTVVAKGERNSAIFGHICLHLARFFLHSGYHYAVHYCAPAKVALYERLGYRQYAEGRNLEAGVFRLPLFLMADDISYFRRIRSPFRSLGGDEEKNRPWLYKATTLCKELNEDPLCALSEAELRAKILTLCPGLEITPALLRMFRRGALLRIHKGAILAPQGIDEGSFLPLTGRLSSGGKPLPLGNVCPTGAGLVRAEEDSTLLCVNVQGVVL